MFYCTFCTCYIACGVLHYSFMLFLVQCFSISAGNDKARGEVDGKCRRDYLLVSQMLSWKLDQRECFVTISYSITFLLIKSYLSLKPLSFLCVICTFSHQWSQNVSILFMFPLHENDSFKLDSFVFWFVQNQECWIIKLELLKDILFSKLTALVKFHLEGEEPLQFQKNPKVGHFLSQEGFFLAKLILWVTFDLAQSSNDLVS